MRIFLPRVRLPTHRASFNLYALGDVHKGTVAFEEKYYREVLEIIKSDESQKYVVWMGDYANHFPKFDRRGDRRLVDKKYSNVLDTYSSIRDDIKPFKKETVCILEGNHDADWFMAEEQDYISWICTELGLPYAPLEDRESPYGTYEAYIRFKVSVKKERGSRRNINMIAWHGGGAPRTKGGAVNVLERPSKTFPYLNVCLMGHLHRHGIVSDDALDIDEGTRRIKDETRYYVFTGAFMKGYPEDYSSYVSKKMLPPMGLGAVKLTIQPFAHVCGTDKLRVTWTQIP